MRLPETCPNGHTWDVCQPDRRWNYTHALVCYRCRVYRPIPDFDLAWQQQRQVCEALRELRDHYDDDFMYIALGNNWFEPHGRVHPAITGWVLEGKTPAGIAERVEVLRACGKNFEIR